ncbi:hypothetical protein ACFSTE_13425 [Aquimarina hainanensis]|uniref:Uncharacterized protein n=1 Tax=Aquimarina hainanensis TaxID=1578017 RepID=A0ABW5N890_9FLAO
MIKEAVHTAITGTTYQSLHIHMEGGQRSYRVLKIARKKTAIRLVSETVLDKQEALWTVLSKNHPILVSFSGQGIITKKVANSKNYQSEIIYNAAPEQFFWFEYVEEDSRYVSIARKELINEELTAISEKGFYTHDVSIGPLVLVAIKPLLNVTVIQNLQHQLHFNTEGLQQITKMTSDETVRYHFGEDFIDNASIQGVAQVVQHLFPSPHLLTEESEAVMAARKLFVYRKLFNISGAFVLGFFLLSLLVSYLLLQFYQEEYHTTQVKLGEQNITYSKLVSLEKDVKNKTAILTESGLDNTRGVSFYSNAITKDLPGEIRLNDVKLFLPNHKIKQGQRINFAKDEISIEGSVASYAVFSEWIKQLKKKPWIQKLEIIDFQGTGRENVFVIKLKVRFNV